MSGHGGEHAPAQQRRVGIFVQRPGQKVEDEEEGFSSRADLLNLAVNEATGVQGRWAGNSRRAASVTAGHHSGANSSGAHPSSIELAGNAASGLSGGPGPPGPAGARLKSPGKPVAQGWSERDALALLEQWDRDKQQEEDKKSRAFSGSHGKADSGNLASELVSPTGKDDAAGPSHRVASPHGVNPPQGVSLMTKLRRKSLSIYEHLAPGNSLPSAELGRGSVGPHAERPPSSILLDKPVGLRKQRRNSYSYPERAPMMPDVSGAEHELPERQTSEVGKGKKGSRRSSVSTVMGDLGLAFLHHGSHSQLSPPLGAVPSPTAPSSASANPIVSPVAAGVPPLSSAPVGPSSGEFGPQPGPLRGVFNKLMSIPRSRSWKRTGIPSHEIEPQQQDEAERLSAGIEGLQDPALQALPLDTPEGAAEPLANDQPPNHAPSSSPSFRKNQAKQNLIKPLSTLPPFVPDLLKLDVIKADERYQEFDAALTSGKDFATASKLLKPSMTHFDGAVMIADVKGFTQLTEILSKKGTAGVELLTNCMNNYFTRVINMIAAFDGDVIKFAGDSMIVAFYPNDSEAQLPDHGYQACVSRCCQCAHVLATRLGHMRMKMNGQVEPINPEGEKLPEPPVESEIPSEFAGDLLRRNSGPFSRKRHAPGLGSLGSGPVDSPRSSTTAVPPNSAPLGMGNRPTSEGDLQGAASQAISVSMEGPMPSGIGLMPTSSGTVDVATDPNAGSLRPVFQRSRSKASKTWLSNALMRRPANASGRRSDVNSLSGMSPGAGSAGAAATNSNKSGGSSSDTARRARSRTELATNLRSSENAAASLFGNDTTVAKRELSLASKLQLPPPVRGGLGTSNLRTSIGSAPTMDSGNAPRSSFSEQNGQRRGSMRMMGALGSGVNWASRVQNLSSDILNSGNSDGGQPQGSRLSQTVIGNWDTLHEEEEREHEDDGVEEEEEEEEPSGYGEDLGLSPDRMDRMLHHPAVEEEVSSSQHTNAGGGPVKWSTDSYTTEAVHSFTQQQSNTRRAPGMPMLAQNLGSVAKRPGPASLPDMMVTAGSSGHIQPGTGGESLAQDAAESSDDSDSNWALNTPFAKGQPIAEGWEAGPHRGMNHTGQGSPAGDSPGLNPRGSGLETSASVTSPDALRQASGNPSTTMASDREGKSFVSKVVSWFGKGGKGGNPDSFSHAYPGHEEGSGEDVHSHPSMSARSNSFNQGGGVGGGGGGGMNLGRLQHSANPPNYGKSRDPVMEEVQNSTFSLKVMVSAGEVCVFQVGGNIDEATDPGTPEIPRWEFFIGDRALAPELDEQGRRRCIAQLAAIEKHAEAGDVVISREVLVVIEQDWEIEQLPDEVWKLLAPCMHIVPPGRNSILAHRHSVAHPPAHAHPDSDTRYHTAKPYSTSSVSAVTAAIASATEAQPPISAPIPEGGGVLVPSSADAARRARERAERGSGDGGDDDDEALQPEVRHEFSHLPEHIQRRIASTLRMQVLGSIRRHVEAGHLDFITEIRPLTCIFLGFPSLSHHQEGATLEDQVNSVQFTVQQIQNVMRKWDGSFMQYRCDEKGFVAICAFGLPGHTHEDNPSRGILAALELLKKIKEGMHTVSVGVTTGDLLCTCVGARKIRSEYTVFGDAINLSARLMVKCKNGLGDILCDEPTHVHAKRKANYEELEPLTVKGKKLPVLVYRVTPYEDDSGENGARQLPEEPQGTNYNMPDRPLIGRDAEMTLILNKAANMISGMATGGAIIIEGNTGMGKTKLLTEVRKSLERINSDTTTSGKPAFHLLFGVADIANKSQKLHPWRRIFQELFSIDLNRGFRPQVHTSTARGLPMRRRSHLESGADDANCPVTLLGDRLTSRIPSYNMEWRKHLAELLDLQLQHIPRGSRSPHDEEFISPEMIGAEGGGTLLESASMNVGGYVPVGPSAGGSGGNHSSSAADSRTLAGHHQGASLNGTVDFLATPSMGVRQQTPAEMGGFGAPQYTSTGSASLRERDRSSLEKGSWHIAGTSAGMSIGAGAGMQGQSGFQVPSGGLASMAAGGSGAANRGVWRSTSLRRTPSNSAAPGPPTGGAPGARPALQTQQTVIGQGGPGGLGGGGGPLNAASPLKKNSLNFLVHVIREFVSLYGPIIILLENLHEFDTWSWQLLVKVAEVLSSNCLILATTRPNEPPAVGNSHHLHGKAALYQKVAMMYRHLLKLNTTSRIHLEPYNFHQTKALMQVVADINYPDQYVLAVMEKTGGMPLYIEKVTEFLCQKPWLADQGGEFAANVNKMIRNLNFQQVIIERMDRLKPGIHLSLKVASVMGQWVDLDILHKFYPINKTREELRGHLMELERGNFLKPTDTEGVWEFNMVERDIVYEVIPHYQRRRLHAKLAQELEKSLEEHHVATLTTIAYHWNQACMGHEVTEVECALKAIEYWHRAAEAAYSGSSLMEALRLYQKAAQIAEILGESLGDSMHRPQQERRDEDPDGVDGNGNQSFTAVGAGFKGTLNWSLISRITRAQWEKSMASCCLGIVLQHRYEFNNQMEYWDTEDYFTLLTEHAIRGLMLLGAPHPKTVLQEGRSKAWWLFCCGGGQDTLSGWQAGVVLQDQEVTEIRDILLVLIIAAEHYSLQHDGEEYTRLLTFCKRVCKFFNKCSDTGLDPFMDIRSACSVRIKNFKASKALHAHNDFALTGPLESVLGPGQLSNPMGPHGGSAAVVGPDLSRSVLSPRGFANSGGGAMPGPGME